MLSSHAASPVCAMAYVERPRAVFLIALQARLCGGASALLCACQRAHAPRAQEDAGVAAWVRVAGKEWRPLASVEAYAAAGAPLTLPPAVGHRGDVRSACVCAHTPRAPPPDLPPSAAAACAPCAAADLVWLLHRRDGGRTELLVRTVPLQPEGAATAAAPPGGGAYAVERLGKYSDATALLCAGGSDLWVWTARGVAYRWCMHTRRCLSRVDVAAAGGRSVRAASGMRAPVPTLHHPSRELLALCPDGTVLAVAPALRPAAVRDDGFADGRQGVAVRRVSAVGQLVAGGGCAYDAAAHGPFLFVLQRNALARVVGVARSPFMLGVYHLPTGSQLGLTELPPLDAGAGEAPAAPAAAAAAALLNARAGGVLLWLAGATASCVAMVAPDVADAVASVVRPLSHCAVSERLAAAPPDGASDGRASAARLQTVAALLGEVSAWGGSLERCEAALALTLTQASLRASCAPGTEDFATILAAAAARSRAGAWRNEADADKLPGAVHPALRSLVTLQALLNAGASDSPIVALAAAQAADAIHAVYGAPPAGSRTAAAAAAAFHVYTPLAAAIAPLAASALHSHSSLPQPAGRTKPDWVWAALQRGNSRGASHDLRAWAHTGLQARTRPACRLLAHRTFLTRPIYILQVAALAGRECLQRREHAAAASVALFACMLHTDVACECAGLDCMRAHNVSNADRLDALPETRAALLATALARAVGAHAAAFSLHAVQVRTLSPAPVALRAPLKRCHCVQASGVRAFPHAAAPLAMPAFESVCRCLAATLPSALPLFVHALCAPTAPPLAAPARRSAEQMQLAQRALHVLPPVLGQQPPAYSCAAAQQAALCCHAELLCMAGKQAAGMWLALHSGAPGAQTDWATALRLLEKECSLGGSAGAGGALRDTLLLTVPLMFEVLALKVCETLAPEDASGEAAVSLLGVHADDESEILAACVAHLFIAAKTVAAAVRRDATAGSAVRARPFRL